MMMTDLAFISETRPPWLLMTQREIARRDVPDGILLVEADAALMMNWEEGLFPQLATVFQFPDYFGDNCHALNECITDLDWLPAEGYLFVIKNSASLLLEESDDDLGVLLRILDRAGKEWATPVKEGEWWDREVLPFHTILQMSEDEMPGFQSRLEKPRFEIGVL